MKTSLKNLFMLLTGICIGLALAIGFSNHWRIDIEFGRYWDGAVTYTVTTTHDEGGRPLAETFTNMELPTPPYGYEFDTVQRTQPSPAPPGSENDPDWQAQIRDRGDGTIELLPTPAIRKLRRPQS